MRSTKRCKTPKKSFRDEKVNKKRHKIATKISWGWNDNLSGLFIDDINEAIRTRKARRTDGKGCWKLVPKDSCEIYKDRKKRATSRKKSVMSTEDKSNDKENRMEEDKKDKKRIPKKKTKRSIQGNKGQAKKKRKTRSVSRCSSMTTEARTSGSSMSLSTCSDKSHMDSCHCYH